MDGFRYWIGAWQCPARVEEHLKSSEIIWITWERHRRSREISRNLGATLHEFNRKGGRFMRYLSALVSTTRVLARSRGKIVIVQSPSIVLAWFAACTRALFGFTLIVDAHNGGIEPLEGRYPILRRIAHFAIRKAALTIVTTTDMADQIREIGGRGFVLVDPIPEMHAPPSTASAAPKKSVVAISSWAADEPMEELIGAGGLLPEGIQLSITGRPKLSDEAISKLPASVRLTRYLSEDDYVALLRDADVIVDLTTRENCLVCGAYEALALARPLVVSETAALRELLANGALYTRNVRSDIVATALKALERGESLASAARERSVELQSDWQSRKTQLLSHFDSLRGRRVANA